MKKRVLVVCSGNICRSPLAEGVIRQKAEAAGLAVDVESAGTSSWHVGAKPDARAIVASRLLGYDISAQKARLMVPQDFANFDLILVVDREIKREVEALRPTGVATPSTLITDYSTDPEMVGTDVPDPYYSAKFTPVIEMLETCVDGLIARLASQNT